MTASDLVGIQGFAGANHEIAARQLYGDNVELAYIQTFDELFAQLKDRKIGRAVVAYSNTTIEDAFIKAPHRELLMHGTDYWLTDKTEVQVRHQLLALPGATLNDIETVRSMGVALEQCERTLHALLPNARWVYEDDTALSAQIVSKDGDMTQTAIATGLAGELNDLQVLVPDIQDDSENRTGFYGWSLRDDGLAHMTGEEDKTLMVLKPSHVDVAGTLIDVLSAFKDQDINLADLHSISVPGSGKRGKQFLIEADSGFQSESMRSALKVLGTIGCIADVLGSWVDTTS